MTKILLPKKIIMARAIHELGLSGMSLIGAVRTIQIFAEFDGLNIYFDNYIVGIKPDTPIGEQFSYSTGIAYDGSEYMIEDFKDVESVGPDDVFELRADKKSVTRYQIREINGECRLSFNLLSQHGIDYCILNEACDDTVSLELPIGDFYLDRDDFAAFKNRLNKPPSNSRESDDHVDGPMKALALLARELAENSAKFRTGNKVNSRAVKDHLLELATMHHNGGNAYSAGGNTDSNPLSAGLKSIDDKLNKALDVLVLKEILKNPDSKQ